MWDMETDKFLEFSKDHINKIWPLFRKVRRPYLRDILRLFCKNKEIQIVFCEQSLG